ncbi:hypothetical protein AAOGI_06730 [Agarivorans albus]
MAIRNRKKRRSAAKKSVSKAAGTKGKGRLKKGYKYLKGGRIVKVK